MMNHLVIYLDDRDIVRLMEARSYALVGFNIPKNAEKHYTLEDFAKHLILKGINELTAPVDRMKKAAGIK